MAFLDSYRVPTDLPTELPVFPLLGAILLPRATLPLNIFEPRYLSMIDTVMSGNRILGIIQPDKRKPTAKDLSIDDDEEDEEGGDNESPGGKSALLRHVGCAGRVTSYSEQDDGRVMIVLSGICRFRFVEEVKTSAAYRTTRVTYAPFEMDFEEGIGEEDVDRAALLRVLKSYLESNRLNADWNTITKASSEFLINALSVMSPYGPEEKQALLEAADLKTRADVFVALAEMELASGGDAGGTLQ